MVQNRGFESENRVFFPAGDHDKHGASVFGRSSNDPGGVEPSEKLQRYHHIFVSGGDGHENDRCGAHTYFLKILLFYYYFYIFLLFFYYFYIIFLLF